MRIYHHYRFREIRLKLPEAIDWWQETRDYEPDEKEWLRLRKKAIGYFFSIFPRDEYGPVSMKTKATLLQRK